MMRVSCERLAPSYQLGIAILFVLIMLYTPRLDFFMRYWVFMAALAFFSAIYSWNDNEEIIYYKQPCLYALAFKYLIIIVSLYQIIFGDPTNWLGTGIDLSPLPEK